MSLSAKVCPKCGAKSAAQKNFCDACGTPLAAPGAASSPDPGIPQTAIRKIGEPSAPPARSSLPPAGRSVQSYEGGAYGPAGPGTEPPRTTPRRGREFLPHGLGYVLHGAFSVLVMLAVLGMTVFAVLRVRGRGRSIDDSQAAAAQVLTLWARGAASLIHETLTTPAKNATSPDDLLAARGVEPWAWSNLRLLRSEPEAALFGYDAGQPGKPQRPQTLLLVQENDRWAQPYNAIPLRKAATALARREPDIAAMHAQMAASLDPRDPVARLYLCEALTARRMPQAAAECAAAERVRAAYPERLDERQTQRLRDLQTGR